MRLAAALILILFLCPLPVGAQADTPVGKLIEESRQHYRTGELDSALIKMQKAVDLIWEETPIFVSEATLVARKSAGYGKYEPRSNNVYGPGESIMIYVEPMGFSHKALPDGQWEFGVEVDFIVKQPNGVILGGQAGVMKIVKQNRRKTKELSLSLTYTISGAPPGKYVIETVLRDVVTKQTTSFDNTVVFR